MGLAKEWYGCVAAILFCRSVGKRELGVFMATSPNVKTATSPVANNLMTAYIFQIGQITVLGQTLRDLPV